jgi:hypothetical protein
MVKEIFIDFIYDAVTKSEKSKEIERELALIDFKPSYQDKFKKAF